MGETDQQKKKRKLTNRKKNMIAKTTTNNETHKIPSFKDCKLASKSNIHLQYHTFLYIWNREHTCFFLYGLLIMTKLMKNGIIKKQVRSKIFYFCAKFVSIWDDLDFFIIFLKFNYELKLWFFMLFYVKSNSHDFLLDYTSWFTMSIKFFCIIHIIKLNLNNDESIHRGLESGIWLVSLISSVNNKMRLEYLFPIKM